MKLNGENTFECISCRLIETGTGEELCIKEKINSKPGRKQGVVEDKNIFANYSFVCKKCGYDKAEVIERQPYISDEDSLTFLRCGKCSFTIQLARKIG
jgi:DNA-directed RNA polymerase subunit M/transcription elongation factor TFIIS